MTGSMEKQMDMGQRGSESAKRMAVLPPYVRMS
jgi:hypothetical protein